ncbi:MAG: hypothetical protein OEY07_21380, partial [Gammaproteobacteria bacterium]|nr:hypothetical protein [Gammaproteobacteria bacterium]
MRRLCFVIPLTIGLAACAGSSAFPPTSPYYRIPAGSRVIVKQSLPIPANRSRAWIQYGKVIHKKERDQYYPHCWFLSHKRSDSPREIKPDTFTVVETRKLEEYVADQRSFRLAASRHLGG